MGGRLFVKIKSVKCHGMCQSKLGIIFHLLGWIWKIVSMIATVVKNKAFIR
jgi:hypothetical protein